MSGKEGKEGKEGDHLNVDIECLNPETMQATLISTVGSHCEVWRTSMKDMASAEAPYKEFVIKCPRDAYGRLDARVLSKQYRLLKDALDDVMPDAVFALTHIEGKPNICVLADAVDVWFNIANPQYEEEAVELLKRSPKARNQLQRFITAAEELRESNDPRVIDLFGVDNLVMDTNHEIRYLDSFYIFFFEDMLHMLDEPDPELKAKIDISLKRLAYLERVLELSS